MRIFKLLPAILLFYAFAVGAQNTNLTATVIDSDGTTWVNGTWHIDFRANPDFPNPTIYNINGTPLDVHVMHQDGTLDSSGFMNVTIYDSTKVSPAGSGWVLKVCPLSSSPCGTYIFSSAGTSQDISAALTSTIPPPRFNPLAGSYGYNDSEATVQLVPGSTYFNVTDSIQRFYFNGVWSEGALPGGIFCTGSGAAQVCNFPGSNFVGPFNKIIYMSGLGRYTYDSTGFQNAINDCYALYNSGTNTGGCKVITGYGNFALTQTLNILPGVSFIGGGTLGTIFTGNITFSPTVRVLNNAPVGNRGGIIGEFSINAGSGQVGLEVQGAVSRIFEDISVSNATSACTVFANAQNLRMIAIDNSSCGAAASGSVDTNYTLTGVKAPQPNPRTYALTTITKNNAPVLTISSVASSVNGLATYTTSTDLTTLCSTGLIKSFPFAVTGFPQINGGNSPNNGNFYAIDCTAPSTLVLRNASALAQTATGTATGIASQVLTVSGADPNFSTDCANGYVQKPFMLDTTGFVNALNNTTGAPRQVYSCDSTHIYTGNWSAVNESASATATMYGYTTTYTSADANLAADCKKGYLRGFFPLITGFVNGSNNIGPAEIKACDWVNNTVTLMNLNGVNETHAGTLTFHGDRAGACMRSTWGSAGYTVWGGEQSNCAPFGILYHDNQQIDSSVRYDTGTSLICAICSAPSVDNAYQGIIIENPCTGGTGTTCANASAISVASVGVRAGSGISFVGSGGGLSSTGLHYPFSFFWSDDVDYDGITSSKPHAIRFTDMQVTSSASSTSPCTSDVGGCTTLYDMQQTTDVRDGESNRRNTSDLLYKMDDFSNLWEGENNTDGVTTRFAKQAGGTSIEETEVFANFQSSVRIHGLALLESATEFSQQFELGAVPSTSCPSYASCTMDSLATIHYFTGLTANLTLNAPLNPHFSSELIVIIQQDAVGGRTVTWNAAFKFGNNPCPLDTTALATSTYRFVNFGSWQLVSCTGAAAAASKYTIALTNFCDGVIGTAISQAYWLAPAATAAVGCASTGVTPMPTPIAGTVTGCTATASVGGAAADSGTVRLVKFTWSGTAWTQGAGTAICTFGTNASTAACTSGILSIPFGVTNGLPDAYAISVTTRAVTGSDTTANVRTSCSYQTILQ